MLSPFSPEKATVQTINFSAQTHPWWIESIECIDLLKELIKSNCPVFSADQYETMWIIKSETKEAGWIWKLKLTAHHCLSVYIILIFWLLMSPALSAAATVITPAFFFLLRSTVLMIIVWAFCISETIYCMLRLVMLFLYIQFITSLKFQLYCKTIPLNVGFQVSNSLAVKKKSRIIIVLPPWIIKLNHYWAHTRMIFFWLFCRALELPRAAHGFEKRREITMYGPWISLRFHLTQVRANNQTA